MRSFVKVWTGIALIAIGGGAIMIAITFAAGVSFYDIADRGWNAISGYSGDGIRFSGADPEDVEDGTDDGDNHYTFAETFRDVKSVDIDIEYGEVDIITGEEFSIKAERLQKNGLEAYVSDGIWYVREKEKYARDRIWNTRSAPKITITIPENFIAEDFKLTVKAGDVEAEEIAAVQGEFNVSAGRLSVSGLNITGESKYTVGAGQMQLKNVVAGNITASCSVGELVIKGDLTGDNDINCEIGRIDIDLAGKEEDYSYDVSVTIGTVDVGGKSYHNVSNKIIRNSDEANNNLPNHFTLDCEIGNITVDFD